MGSMGDLQNNVASNFVLGDMGMLQGHNTIGSTVMGSMGDLQNNVASNFAIGGMGMAMPHPMY